jgi:hypothetical protein
MQHSVSFGDDEKGQRNSQLGGGALDLAVLQVGVNVFDEGIIWVPNRESQLAEGATSDVGAHRLHQQLWGEKKVTYGPHIPAFPFPGSRTRRPEHAAGV